MTATFATHGYQKHPTNTRVIIARVGAIDWHIVRADKPGPSPLRRGATQRKPRGPRHYVATQRVYGGRGQVVAAPTIHELVYKLNGPSTLTDIQQFFAGKD
jgi:hypothetical protein